MRRNDTAMTISDEYHGGCFTYLASEESLARSWLSQEEEEAWAHLQDEVKTP